MRFYLAAIVASLFLVSCGENKVRIEIRGGDGNLVRLDANSVQYKFNKHVSEGVYVLPEQDSDIDLRPGSYTVSVSTGRYLESRSVVVETAPISGTQEYSIVFEVPTEETGKVEPYGTIVYASTPQTKRSWDLFSITADGTKTTRLTDTKETEQHPAWSPDGQKILFTRGEAMSNIDIYKMNQDGSGIVRLTEHEQRDQRACWSPDGNQIAFVSQRDGEKAVWIMNADGSNKRKLIAGREPSWSPDGNQIAFTSSAFHDNDEIYVINIDGSDKVRLTNNRKFDWFPSWDPVGRRVAYNSEQYGGQELILSLADGTGIIRITNAEKTYEQEPIWSPDGKSLAYAGKMQEDDYDIYIVSTRGFDLDDIPKPIGMPLNLTDNNDRDDMSPDWRSF